MDEAALRKLAERNRGNPVAERLAAYLDHAERGEREPTLEEAAWAACLGRRAPL